MKKKTQPFTSNNEYGSKFLFWSLVAFKPTDIITLYMYCYVALSFIAGEANSHVLKFILKFFTFPRMLNKNITFQIIFFFHVSVIGLNTTLVFSLGGLSRFYGSDINFLILFFFSFCSKCVCVFVFSSGTSLLHKSGKNLASWCFLLSFFLFWSLFLLCL